MKRHCPVHVIVYFPKTAEDNQVLARRVSEIHADFVYRRINRLNCPTTQKLQLLDAVIATATRCAHSKD